MKTLLKVAALMIVANSLFFSVSIADDSKVRADVASVINQIRSAQEMLIDPTVPCPHIGECPDPFGDDKN